MFDNPLLLMFADYYSFTFTLELWIIKKTLIPLRSLTCRWCFVTSPRSLVVPKCDEELVNQLVWQQIDAGWQRNRQNILLRIWLLTMTMGDFTLIVAVKSVFGYSRASVSTARPRLFTPLTDNLTRKYLRRK